jgi:hypothetical protein
MFAIGRRAPEGDVCRGRGERAAQEQTAGMGLVRRFSRPLTYLFGLCPSSCTAGIVLIWAAWPPVPKEGINCMNEKTIYQIEDALGYEVSDEAVEAAGTRSEIAGAWTWVCTGIGCNYSPNVSDRPLTD